MRHAIYASEKLSGRMDEAALWGVDPDPVLLAALESTALRSSNLKTALREYTGKEAELRNEIAASIAHTIEDLAQGNETGKVLAEIGKKVSVADTLRLLIVEVQSAVRLAEEDLTRAAADLSNFLAAAVGQVEQECRERYRAFRGGTGSRPLSEEAGYVKMRCEDCQGIIALVDAESLGYPITAAMFRRSDGSSGAVFDPSARVNQWKCPACGRSPFRDSRFILTERWAFLAVPAAKDKESDL